MGISNDITPKHLPKRKSEEENISHIAAKTADFDILSLSDTSGSELPASEIEDSGQEKKKSNDRLAEEFFDKKSFKEVKKTKPAQEPSQSASPDIPKKQSSLLNIKFLWTLFVILLMILGWQNFDFIKKLFVKETVSVETSQQATDTPTEQTSETSQAETQTTTPTTQAPTSPITTAPATPVPVAIDKASITIKVLNGNGITGRAATVTSLLTTAGFKVSSTTNAKRFTYATTIVYFHDGKQAEADLVKAALPTYSVTTVMDNSVTSTTNLVVVVGKK